MARAARERYGFSEEAVVRQQLVYVNVTLPMPVVDRGRSIARVPFDAVRISVSWKAYVFADAVEAERVDRHSDDLDPERVCAMLAADLRRRGIDLELADDPLSDSAFMAALTDAYPRSPTVFPEL